jgi:hypothetical protein
MSSDMPGTAFEAWRRRSASGAILTGIALGLQYALEPDKTPPAIVQQVPGEPPGPPEPFEVHVEPDHPEETVVVIRSWLMNGPG